MPWRAVLYGAGRQAGRQATLSAVQCGAERAARSTSTNGRASRRAALLGANAPLRPPRENSSMPSIRRPAAATGGASQQWEGLHAQRAQPPIARRCPLEGIASPHAGRRRPLAPAPPSTASCISGFSWPSTGGSVLRRDCWRALLTARLPVRAGPQSEQQHAQLPPAAERRIFPAQNFKASRTQI